MVLFSALRQNGTLSIQLRQYRDNPVMIVRPVFVILGFVN